MKYRHLLLTLATFSTISVVFYLSVYRLEGIRQTLFAAVIIFLSTLPAPIAYLAAKWGKQGIAGGLVLGGVFIAYGCNELFWIGLTPYHIIGGTLLLILTGILVMPRKPLIWVLTISLYGLYILAVNYLSPFPRYDATGSTSLNIYALGTNVGLVLALFILLLVGSQGRSIRTRLVITFLLLVLVPVTVSSAISSYLSTRNAQRQVINQLDSVVTLKESEILNWVRGLEPNLYVAITQQGQQEQLWMVETLITDYPSTQVYYLDIYSKVKERFQETIDKARIFDEVFLMDLQGTVVLSTDHAQEGGNKASRNYFSEGLTGGFVSPPFREPDLNQVTMVASTPFLNDAGDPIAILAGRVNLDRLNEIMAERAGLGNTGETYLVSQSHLLMTSSRFEGYATEESQIYSEGINSVLEKRISGSGTYTGYRGVPVIAVYRWIPELEMGLLAEQDEAEAFRAIYGTLFANIGAAAIAVATAILVALIATRRITRPIARLAETAERIAAGDVNLIAEVEQEDEIGALAKAFNAMTSQLRTLIGSLEQRVTERTDELERRSMQLQVAAEVARDAARVRDLDELLNHSVNLIHDRFSLYHAGIFLIDEHGEYAVLRASTGEAGREMLNRGHRLKVGETGIVGHVTGEGKPRVVSDVGEDTIHFKNPLLPETRAEAALPLKIGERIIGALDVQSTQHDTFDEQTVGVLQIMSDQLAVAIENVRLLRESQRSIHELETAYGRYTQKSWQDFFLHTSHLRGLRYRGLTVEPVDEKSPEAQLALEKNEPVVITESAAGANGDSESILAVPMRLRGQAIGAIHMRFKAPVVAPESVALFEEVASRLSLALDNVRLLEESQFRSEQLNLLQEITAAAVSHVDLVELLDSIAQKIHQGFDLHHCGVLLFDADGKCGTLVADISAPSAPGASRSGIKLPLENNEGYQEAIRTQKTVAIYDVQSNPIVLPIQGFMKSRATNTLMVVPLLSRGEVIGVIDMEVHDPTRRFSDDDLRLADQISLQVAAAIDVARLFEQTENRAERERQISQITSQMRETLDIETVLQTAVRELRRTLNLAEVEVRLGTETTVQKASARPGEEKATYSKESR